MNEEGYTTLEWINSKHNTRIPLVDGFRFKKSKTYKGLTYWNCQKENCNVKLHTEGEVFKLIKGTHAHDLREDLEFEVKLKDEINSYVASSPFSSAKAIYDTSLRKMNFILQDHPLKDAIICNLQNFDSIKSSIYRKKTELNPALSENNLPFNLNEELCKTVDGNQFVFLNNLNSHNEIVFADLEFIKRLNLYRCAIHMDGTFKSCPRTFYQLYIIHVVERGQSFPVFFCFLKQKTLIAYKRILLGIAEKLNVENIRFLPTSAMIDFEYASYGALISIWPMIIIKGCYFHFGQAIWRRVNSEGFKGLYNDGTKPFKEIVKLCMALPLVPLNKLNDAWGIIVSKSLELQEDVTEFIDYIGTYWMYNNRALFDRRIWNHFDTQIARTNNVAEAFHSKLSKILSKSHPNFYHVVTTFSNIQFEMSIQLSRIEAGHAPIRKKIKYVLADNRIRNLKSAFLEDENFTLESLERYMKNVSSAIKFIVE